MILLYIATILLTSLNNWGVPVLIYWKKYGLFKKRPAGFIGCNFWGVIMDVFLASSINIVILTYILSRPAYITNANIINALILGFVFTVIIHFFMAVTYWKVWIMPKPWHWNLAGYWHMISMTLQMSFAFFPLILFWLNPNLIFQPDAKATFSLVGVFAVLFLISLYYCNRGLKIGRFEISGKPW